LQPWNLSASCPETPPLIGTQPFIPVKLRRSRVSGVPKTISESTSQNFTGSMSSGTIDWMKVLAVKGIEEQGNIWAVRYSRKHGKNVQDALFLYKMPEEAKKKYVELLDVLVNRNGVYVGSKEKRKLKASRRNLSS
jgi:hypothetical protein